MRLAHLSDLHLSRYGETGTWTQRGEDEEGWEQLHAWQRWSIEGLKDKKNRPDRVRLVDPEGVVHWVKGWPKKDDKLIGSMLSLAMERHLTSSENLIKNRPAPEDLSALLKVDRHNTNLLFLNLLEHLQRLTPEVIVLTGDMTDNGFGYALIEHYLKPWIDRHRLLVVPGNHDTYEMFPRKGRKARIALREDGYKSFAEHVECQANETGAYLRYVGDVAVVGLSSCKAPITILSASGEVTEDQLTWLRQLGTDRIFASARLRIALLHHHILRMPFELTGRQPIEMGMRLRNAAEVMRACTESGINMVFNGHRHHGYMVQLPGMPSVISSPSSTLGCKSTDMRYVWMVDLAARYPFPVAFPMNGRYRGMDIPEATQPKSPSE
ncbi:MAG: metallophosphoesterase [Deltaproteobacteria bacterium]|nr:metallophosphoesterase [Deltaproteobacteria bacterium]